MVVVVVVVLGLVVAVASVGPNNLTLKILQNWFSNAVVFFVDVVVIVIVAVVAVLFVMDVVVIDPET